MNMPEARLDAPAQRALSGTKGSGRPEKGKPSIFPPESTDGDLTCPALTSGTLLGQSFRIIEPLEANQPGDFYRAHDILRAEDVALQLRVVRPASREPADFPFHRAVRLWKQVSDHEHVLPFHDVHIIPYGGASLAVLSMEYADGGSFQDWLVRMRTDLSRRLTQGLLYFTDLCRGVKALHAAGIVHGTLTTASGQLVKGHVKVIGFWETESLQGAAVPEYLSPARFLPAQTHPPDVQDDIYSLGVILYALSHPEGRTPFSGSYDELRRLHAQAPVPPHPSADEKLQTVLARCLAKDPALRYSSVDELLGGLVHNPADTPPGTHTDEAAALKAAQLWETAEKAAANGAFLQALRLCSAVLEIDPVHEDARGLANELHARFAEAEAFYGMIEREMGARDLAETAALLQEAISIFPDHPAGRRIQVDALLRAEAFNEQVRAGALALCRKQWDLGVQWFSQAQGLCRTSSEMAQALNEARAVREHVHEMRHLIDAAVASGDRSSAFALAQSLDEYTDAAAERFRAAFQQEGRR